ncbi:TonB-dependent receptor [Betaproteobacteria bacterium]|nr:TonB-dependent receptor [Betaproteobacteria bacterium]GHU46187.1 TonB-dependent receptor [Betaproteobacteria bacterium]
MKALPPYLHRSACCTITAALALAFQSAYAADTVSAPASGEHVFTLGQITVTGNRDDAHPVGTDSLDREKLWEFNRDGLVDALALEPGVNVAPGAGSRNEAEISVRGFGRWQVPLLLDGIRLYLPADNRIDFDRFLTPDLSEIQISKGYVSVLNGPDGMGGAINLVTKKPVKPQEGEVRVSLATDANGRYNGNTTYANVGGRQEKWYFQASLEERTVDRWRLSSDFKPTQAENGGDREHIDKEDWRGNLKIGLTPNATDEYSLNYVKQTGEKHGIGAVDGTSTISTWDWPKWDTASLYWLSHTRIDDKTYIKTRAYYNTFENDLVAYTNVSLTTPQWTSYYDDKAYGASVEAGTDHLTNQTLKMSLHYRRDDHTEWQTTHNTGFTEPKQSAVEDTYSLALEDTWHVTPNLDLTGGVSRDWRKSKKAEEYSTSGGSPGFFNYRVADSQANNAQGAAVYRYSDTGKVHFFASNRTRFPTMFERFSSRFGGATSNPWLKPEKALNLEAGIADEIFPGIHAEAALFHNKVKDAIHSVRLSSGPYAGQSQSQNIGEATYKGVEFSLDARILPSLFAGGNYSYIDTRIDNPVDPTARLTSTPHHKAFLYARWKPVTGLTVLPSLEYVSAREANSSGSNKEKTGEYALLGLKITYRITPNWDISLSGKNLLDKNYQLSIGYPQEGRNFLLASRLQF